jgi:hypothetical protein
MNLVLLSINIFCGNIIDKHIIALGINEIKKNYQDRIRYFFKRTEIFELIYQNKTIIDAIQNHLDSYIVKDGVNSSIHTTENFNKNFEIFFRNEIQEKKSQEPDKNSLIINSDDSTESKSLEPENYLINNSNNTKKIELPKLKNIDKQTSLLQTIGKTILYIIMFKWLIDLYKCIKNKIAPSTNIAHKDLSTSTESLEIQN